MATLETTVSSPRGQIFSFAGRKPKAVAIEDVRKHLQRVIIDAEEHLRELDNWTVESHRGSVRALSYEECLEKGLRP